MLQILLAVFGLVALVRGEFKVTKNRRVSGSTGRLCGVLMLAAVAISLFIPDAICGIGTLIGALIFVVIIGLSSTEEI